jgi:hypothetical protein
MIFLYFPGLVQPVQTSHKLACHGRIILQKICIVEHIVEIEHDLILS